MDHLTRVTRKRLGELLVASKHLTDEQVQEGLQRQQESGGLLGEIFIRRGYLSEGDIAECIGTQFDLPVKHVVGCHIPDDVLELVPVDIMKQCPLVVLDKETDTVTVAVGGPLTEELLSDLHGFTGCEIKLVVSLRSEIDTLIADYLDRKKAKS